MRLFPEFIRNLIRIGLIYFALGILSCDSHNEHNVYGLENIDTIVDLQKGHSNKAIADYLAKYSGWKRSSNDSTIGYDFYFTTSKNPYFNARHGFLVDVINVDGKFRLALTFEEHRLFSNYLYQISHDSAYSLVHEIDKNGDVIFFYRGKGCILGLDRMNDLYHLDISPL